MHNESRTNWKIFLGLAFAVTVALAQWSLNSRQKHPHVEISEEDIEKIATDGERLRAVLRKDLNELTDEDKRVLLNANLQPGSDDWQQLHRALRLPAKKSGKRGKPNKSDP